VTLKVGALFAGYGGREMGLAQVLDCEPVWFSEVGKAPSRILAHHWPDVPNHGDITRIDWTQVEPVDVITGGSPCQDVSHAGKRAGMSKGTRSNLWVSMREAIAVLRPSLVVWENVRGAYSACADSDLGRCPRCVDPSHPGRTRSRSSCPRSRGWGSFQSRVCGQMVWRTSCRRRSSPRTIPSVRRRPACCRRQ
jgi:DNA (cytosine-5)-methyltransferase 1